MSELQKEAENERQRKVQFLNSHFVSVNVGDRIHFISLKSALRHFVQLIASSFFNPICSKCSSICKKYFVGQKYIGLR